jgi:hypothetical protein
MNRNHLVAFSNDEMRMLKWLLDRYVSEEDTPNLNRIIEEMRTRIFYSRPGESVTIHP